MNWKIILLALVNSFLINLVGFHSEAVHVPLLVNFLLSVTLGWMTPSKGWIAALIQAGGIILFYFFLSATQLMSPVKPGIAQFAAYIGVLPTLAAAFMGAFFRKTYNQ